MPRGSFRSATATMVLLLAALLLAGGLALEAIRIERERRLAAEKVVRDHAVVAGEELLRRIVFELEEFGSQPVRGAIHQHFRRSDVVPTKEMLAHGAPGLLADGLPLVGTPFRADLQTAQVSPSLGTAIDAWILGEVAELAARNRGPARRFARLDDRTAVIYSAPQRDGRYVYGATIDPRGVRAFAARALRRRPVFPAKLAGGRLGNDVLFVHIAHGGEDVLRTPGTYDPTYGTAFTIVPMYSEVLAGGTMRVSVDRLAVPDLVSGAGVPSRVPYLAGTLLALMAGIVAAVVLFRRERDLVRLRSDFVAGVSHELRTPLAQIKMFAETLLLDRVRTPHERRRSLEIIRGEADRLTYLVENVLLLSRSASGIPLVLDVCDLVPVIGGVTEIFRSTSAGGQRLAVVMPETLVVETDRDAWRQIAINLIDNAIKYGDGTPVRVTLAEEEEHVVLTVDDGGPGIDARHRTHVWERFYRLTRHRQTHLAGSGIGLTVVRELVTTLRGECRIEDAPGGGARFVVRVRA